MTPANRSNSAVGATDARGLTLKTLAKIDTIAAGNQAALNTLMASLPAGEDLVSAVHKLIPRHVGKKTVPLVGSTVPESG